MAHPGGQPPVTACVRHPDRPTGLSCNRCGRPACPDCLREAAVGYQCVDCVREGQRDVRPVRTVAGARAGRPVPYATYVLIAANVLVFAITAVQSRSLLSNERNSALFLDWVLWPLGIANGEYVRIVGSGFLHFGIIHIAVNMLALYVIGRDAETVLGWARYAAVYAVSLLGGAAAVLVFQDVRSVTAGASGAIFGLFGAMAVILIRLRQSPVPVLAMIALNVVISVSIPGISFWGHFGGLVAGAIATAGLLFLPAWLKRAGMTVTDTNARAIGWVSVGVVGVFAIATIVLRAAAIRDAGVPVS